MLILSNQDVINTNKFDITMSFKTVFKLTNENLCASSLNGYRIYIGLYGSVLDTSSCFEERLCNSSGQEREVVDSGINVQLSSCVILAVVVPDT